MKSIGIGNKETELPLFADDMIVEDSRGSTKNILELTSEFMKVNGHKINRQKKKNKKMTFLHPKPKMKRTDHHESSSRN